MLNEILQGLLILKKYFDAGNKYNTGAEHDVFYVYKTDRPLSNSDVKEMKKNNWFQEDVDDYDEEEGWMYYP